MDPKTTAPQQTIAVLGASNNRSKYGNKCVRCYLDVGWRVYPINPGSDTVEGLPAHRHLADIPDPLDRIAVYLPPAITYELLDAIAERAAGDVYFNPGSADPRVLERAETLGIAAVDACAIVAVGRVPAMYP